MCRYPMNGVVRAVTQLLVLLFAYRHRLLVPKYKPARMFSEEGTIGWVPIYASTPMRQGSTPLSAIMCL